MNEEPDAGRVADADPLDDVMAVAAIDYASVKASFSNFGSHVDVSAPGVQLISTYPAVNGFDYATWSGTSFAAPLAAAEAALLLEQEPGHSDVKSVIERTAFTIDSWNPRFAGLLGKGRIDPLAALISLNADASIRPTAHLHSLIDLSRGPAGAEAFGRARIVVSGEDQFLFLEAHGLAVKSAYRLVVDGRQVATSESASLGSVRFLLSSDETGVPLDDIGSVTGIRRLELRDSADELVLQGDFGSDSGRSLARVFEKEARLVSTGELPGAAGRMRIRLESLGDGSRREEFRCGAEGLTSGSPYLLLVDGGGG